MWVQSKVRLNFSVVELEQNLKSDSRSHDVTREATLVSATRRWSDTFPPCHWLPVTTKIL